MAKQSNNPRKRNLGKDAEETPAPMPRGRNVVVAIGIDDYACWPKLHRAVSDAMGVQKLLVERLGFLSPYPPLLNSEATAKNIRSLIKDKLRKSLKPDDSLILFFAGHGHTLVERVGDADAESGYLIPVEAQTDVLSDYLDAEALLKDVGKLPARHVLLILDACRSGFALGEAIQIHRGPVRYEEDLASRVSRKVITSAQRNQDALDGGPIPGHSLFTGTLVQGLNWGIADLDGNSLVTSSELGLYLQQQVGQASGSQQTPDFGSFHLDSRGELVISLRDDNFEAVKARAFGAMLRYDDSGLSAFVRQLTALRPESPETLYLHYRLSLMHGDVATAADAISRLRGADFDEGALPLSSGDIAALEDQLHFWQPLLGVPPGSPPIEVHLYKGLDQAGLIRSASRPFCPGGARLGDAYEIEDGTLVQIEITNWGGGPAHLYSLTFIPDGRLLVHPVLAGDELRFNGLPAGATERGAAFVAKGLPGSVVEMRILYSPRRISAILFPGTTATRDDEHIDSGQVADLQAVTIFLQTPETSVSESEAPVEQPPKRKLSEELAAAIASAPAIKRRFGDWRPRMLGNRLPTRLDISTIRDLRAGSGRRMTIVSRRRGDKV